jgi:hypothetical protein
MLTRDFASLSVRLQPSVPGCPRQTITQYVRDAAIMTCERTLAWRYQQPEFNLTPGTYVYNYTKPADTRVHALFGTMMNGSPLDVLTLDQALTLYPSWADKYTTSGDIEEFGSQPRSITQISPHQFAVLPLPDAEATYTMRMFYALKPTRDASGMDEVMFDELEDVILHGALQQLLVLPGAHWSDRELAAYHAKQYLFQLSERRARANLGNARGVMRVRATPFGA